MGYFVNLNAAFYFKAAFYFIAVVDLVGDGHTTVAEPP